MQALPSSNLQPQLISLDVIKEKYCEVGETTELDIFKRVAKKIASAEKTAKLRKEWEKKFIDMMLAGGIGGGRIMASAGTGIDTTMINCFVIPVADSILDRDEDGYPGIYTALSQSAETLRRGGGVGYDFSRIRPINAYVKGTNSFASGPCSYMNVFDVSCCTVESAGGRRGAQLGALRIDHPDVEPFITAKREKGRWNNFNVSVFVSDAFMEAVRNDGPWELVHKAKPTQKLIDEQGAYQRADGLWVYDTVRAKDLWDKIMKSNYDFAEPGILFGDTANKNNNLHYVETFEACNPCVTGDTVILTDKGYVRIDSVIEQEVSVWNGFEWSLTVPRITGHDQEIIDFEFSDGSKLSTTPYHKFILDDGTRVEAKDLHAGMKLAKHRFPIISGEMDIDTKVAYTQGFYSGDGQKDTNNIWLYEEKCNLIPYLALSSYSDQSNSSQNKRFMATMDHKAEAKNFVPDCSFSIKTRLDWLAGLIDSDGTLIDGCGVQIWSVDRDFLQNVKYLLNSLGASGSISLGSLEGMKSLPNGKGGWAQYHCQTSWRISIPSSHMAVLFTNGLLTHRVTPTNVPNRDAGRFITVTFKHKRDYLEPNVYCFTEEKNHSGIFNGIMTAQCAEQPLPPYGCCDLGAIILPRFVKDPFTPAASFSFSQFEETAKFEVRFLDNVLDTTYWPLKEQHDEAMAKRRVGLGFTGIGNTLAMLNLRYDSPEGRAFAAKIMNSLQNAAYRASIELAKEKGSFPLFDAEKYLQEGTFASRLPVDIKADIMKYGIRNSHLLTIAPTGTVSLAFADNASNGVEPPFSLAYRRKKRLQHGGVEYYTVVDHGVRVFLNSLGDEELANCIQDAMCEGKTVAVHHDKAIVIKDFLPKSIVSALEISAEDHLLMMKELQVYNDSSMSKTINVPEDYPFDDFKNIYLKAHEYGLKGVATYRPNSILGSVLSEIKSEAPAAVAAPTPVSNPNEDYDIFLNKVIHQLPNDEYMARRKRIDYLGPEGNDNFYILVSFDQKTFTYEGKDIVVERPVEVFIETNPDNVPSEWVDSLSRNLSLLARSGLNLFCKALDNCKKAKSDKGKYRYGWIEKADGTKVPRYHASQIDCIGFAVKEILHSRNVISESGKPYRLEQLVKLHHGSDETVEVVDEKVKSMIIYGKTCKECGASAVIKVDGCHKCTNCGEVGECG